MDNKKTIRCKFCNKDCWDVTDYVKSVLKDYYDIIEDNNNYDFLFYSVRGYEHLNEHGIKILINGESDYNDYDNLDYSFSMDLDNHDGKNFFFPHWFTRYVNNEMINFPNHYPHDKDNQNRNKLIAALIRNTNASDRLNSMINVSRYLPKPIENLSGKVGNSRIDKYNALSQYRFNFCYENTCKKGYQTEKIAEAFDAGCIPIYKGDETIEHIFNKEAFINANNLTDEQVAKRIMEINNDNELYNYMIHQPLINEDNFNLMDYKEQFFKKMKEILG